MLYIDPAMDGDFYRKVKPRFAPAAVLRKLLGNRRLVIALVIGVPILSFVVLGNHGILQRIRLQHQKAELEAKVREAEAETKRLEAESRALDGDRKTIEKIAREKYGMARDGETVYRVNRKR